MNLIKKRGEIFENHEGNLIFICCMCDTLNLSLEEIERHLKTHIVDVIKDEYCKASPIQPSPESIYKQEVIIGSKKENNKDIEKINERSSSSLNSKCSFCLHRFPCAGILGQHIASKHFGSQKPFKCITCKTKFSDEQNYSKHITIHQQSNLLSCRHCGQAMRHADLLHHLDGNIPPVSSNNPIELNKLPQSAARRKGERQRRHIHDPEHFKCSVCDKIYLKKSQLLTHLFSHLDEKPYKCHVCGHGFTTIQSLKLHVRRHERHKPYKCEYCTKSFCDTNDLNIHVLSHTGERKHICSLCGHRSATSSNLSRHVRRIHKREKKHECVYKGCGKGFFTRDRLVDHIRTHTGEKPFVCNLCNGRFTLQKSLRLHIKRIHSKM